MRFMLLMIPAGYGEAAPGTMPEAAAVAKMMKYNEELGKAGVLLALDGLHPPAIGGRVTFAGGKAAITDGRPGMGGPLSGRRARHDRSPASPGTLRLPGRRSSRGGIRSRCAGRRERAFKRVNENVAGRAIDAVRGLPRDRPGLDDES